MTQQNEHRYDDLLDLPHHVSATHPPMSALDRAAQFSPFAALSGHGEAMEETARLTDRKLEPSELQLQELNANLCALQARLREKPAVRITYFLPDARKSGGVYVTLTGRLRRIDEAAQLLYLTDDTKIPIDDILSLAPDEEEKE